MGGFILANTDNPADFEEILHEDFCEDILFLRHPHPKVFEKIKNTNEMMSDGVNPGKFEERGGLSLKNYRTFLKIIRTRHNILKSLIYQNKIPGSKRLHSKLSTNDSLKNNTLNELSLTSRDILVILVDFKDRIRQIEPEAINDSLFSENKIPTGSVKEYFHEVSWGNLNITGNVYGWYRARKKYANYVDNNYTNRNTLKWKLDKAQKLVEESIVHLKDKEKSEDFSKYDVNGDGKVDTLIVIYAGLGAERDGDFSNIFPHRGFLKRPIKLQDNLVVDNYILLHELPSYDIGGFCHEITHTLGIPDFYYPDHTSSVLGGWCLMGLGCYNNDGKTPAHLNPWCKSQLGWTQPEKIIGEPELYEIPLITNSLKKIYKLEIQGSRGKEYFLVENRQQKGFDTFLPGHGLLIWHVNENNFLGNFPNLNPSHLFLTLEQADGKKSLETRTIQFKSNKPHVTLEDNVGGKGDPYPGKTNNRSFDRKSRPASNSYKGRKSTVNITLISDSRDIMTARLGNRIPRR
jgi:immune inhibitor A